MSNASMIELLDAGVHFGHRTQKWNPKMKPYIYGARNGIYVIDLRKTSEKLDAACEIAKEFASKGRNIVFVGTKKSAQDVMVEESQRCGMFYINRRWLGGMLTNFETIRSRINKLRELEDFMNSGHAEKLPKKEIAQISRKLSKLSKTLGGIKEMHGMPDLLFVIDQEAENIAIQEANKLKIPVICLADTNANPDGIDYIVPGNDDAIRSIRLISSKIADAVLEGKKIRENRLKSGDKIQNIKAEDAGVEISQKPDNNDIEEKFEDVQKKFEGDEN